MGDFSITIFGFPSALNNVKLKLLLEGRSRRGIIEDVERPNDNSVKLKFSNDENLQNFQDANITEILFGNEMHHLTVLNVTRRGPSPTQHTTLMSGPSARPRTAKSQGGPGRSASIGDFRQEGRPQTTPRRQQTVPRNMNQPKLDLSLYKEVHYWSSIKELPAEEGTLCVLAQNIDLSTHIQTVKMHFESKKRSNGGFIRSIIKMIDGLLIVFQDAKDCENCLEMKDQIFDEKKLQTFGKKIPTFFEGKFVVKGVGSSTSSETLTMFLESCSAKETSPSACKKQSLPGVYLIEYGEDFDPEEADEILKNIQRRLLENKPLKASKLLKTDCLKVTGVQSDVSSDIIRLKFESKKMTDGGPVTRVDRLKNKAILVYFADFTDAERVYKRFKKPCIESIIIGQHPVEVELYFHSLSNDHKNTENEPKMDKPTGRERGAAEPKRPLRSYDFQPGCNEKILFFVKNNQSHSKKLEDSFKELESVEIITEKRGNNRPSVRFSPKKKTDGEIQKTFNAECKRKFDLFLSDYASVSPNFDRSKLQKAREEKLSQLLDKSYKGDGENAVLSWKADSVEVTGLKDAVDKLVDELRLSLDLTAKKMPIDVDQYRLMVSCGIVEELQQNQNHASVNIKCDDRTQSIVFTGTSDDVNTVQINALTIMNRIEKKKLAGMDEIILRYLTEMVKDSLDIKMQIQNKFKSDGVKAALSTDSDDVYIRVRTEADYKKACDSIKQLIGIKKIPLDVSSSAVVSTPPWKRFQQSINGMGSFRVCTKQREEILAVGIRSDLQPLCKKITDFLDENATRRFCLQMSYGSAKFIVEKSKEFSQETCRNEGIRRGLTSDDRGGVYVEGKKESIDKARQQLVQLTRAIKEIQQTLTEPGIKQYYEGEEGKDFLKMTERANNCIILPIKRTCPEWEREAGRGRMLEKGFAIQTPKEQLYISVKLPNSQVMLQVWKTNIIEHKCDVIINASNPELTLLPGGVSGVIGKLDVKNGNVIQTAMHKLIQENRGDYLSGDAVITTSGNLKNCRKIVHAVGPRWTSSNEKDPSSALKACIFGSLQMTAGAGMTSIAIPAISCGVFGGKITVCVPLIVEAVVEYFKEDTTSSIKLVDFVENMKDEVLTEFKRHVQKCGNTKRVSANQQSPMSNPPPQPMTRSANSTSPNVQVLQGDITSTQADVLVNITSANGFQSMGGSSISRSFLKKGGSVILQDCSQMTGPLSPGSVFRTRSGTLPCRELYHGIVTNYNSNNSKNIIRSIVSQCLKTADRSGYSSIAFPAIATGGFGHPPTDVAKWMRQEISNFTPSSLETVIIIVWTNDTTTSRIFQAEFSAASKPPFSFSSGTPFSSSQVSSDQTAGSFGPLNVNVYQGDITQEKSDAIVDSTNSNFDLSQGMISKAILAQGGPGIQTEALNGSGADFRVTSGGNLFCQAIYHIVTPDDHKEFMKTLLMVLNNADQQGLRSISIPAIATGMIGLTSISVAQTMRKCFEAFGQSGAQTLKTINVVIFDQSMLSDFQKGILTTEQSFFGKIKERFNSFFAGSSASKGSSGDEIFNLYFYSTDSEAIKRASNAIAKETKKMVHSQVIQDEAFERLSEWELWELKEAARKNRVKITDKSNRYQKQFTVEGLMRDVLNAHDAAKDILKEFSEAERTATYVTWQKLERGTWKDYQPRAANTLEKAFKARNGNNTDPSLNRIKVAEYYNGRVYEPTVDLSNLDGDIQGRSPPNVRRKVKERSGDDVIPTHWDSMQNQPFRKVKLPSGSQEYQDAKNKFVGTGGPNTIVKIERIQNVSLYRQYIAKKAEVTKKLSGRKTIERQLFHGTTDDDKIILNGFDRSYAGKNATAHGAGVYFAVNASYSTAPSYSRPNSKGHRRIFLAHVITGDYCQGHPSYNAAPLKSSGIQNDVFDSVVNHINAPTVFVIFKDASAYPTFLITFT